MSAVLEFKPSFVMIERPTGPQPLPDWLLGAHINWMDEWGNAPRITLKTTPEVGRWERVYQRIGNHYRSTAKDGRMHELFHNGPVAVRDLGKGRYARCTTKQEGFGGNEYCLKMADGQETILRGPWAGGPPEGWGEAAYVDLGSSWRHSVKPSSRHWRPWFQWTACAGLFFSNDLLVRALSRFCPHIELALVSRYSTGAAHIEPLKPEWSEPKNWSQA